MVESMLGIGGYRAFQDKYGPRTFLRTPLRIDIHDFRASILSTIGEKCDVEEALTWVIVENPNVKFVPSPDLVQPGELSPEALPLGMGHIGSRSLLDAARMILVEEERSLK